MDFRLEIREQLTFAMILALDECELQLKGHIQGNVNVGNTKESLAYESAPDSKKDYITAFTSFPKINTGKDIA